MHVTSFAFTMYIIAALFLGNVMGALLVRLVWGVGTREGELSWPKLRITWER